MTRFSDEIWIDAPRETVWAMTRFSDEIWIDAPRETVWAKIADLGAIQEYHPGVSSSYYTSDEREGLGASRHCDLLPFGEVEERIVEWQAGDSYTFEIYDGRKLPPFANAVGRFGVLQDGDGTTVRFEIEYDLKFGLFGKLLDRLMVRSRFRKVAPAVLRGLKCHLENGARSEVRADRGKEAVNV
jgi:carbon monoxide dehydrogenase subunit G